MSKGWQETLITSQVDGSALASSTTRTSLLPGAAKLTLPPNFFDVIGKKIRVKASGRISTGATPPGTLTLDTAFGSVVGAPTQASAPNVTAQTTQPRGLEWGLTCRASGSSTAANMM